MRIRSLNHVIIHVKHVMIKILVNLVKMDIILWHLKMEQLCMKKNASVTLQNIIILNIILIIPLILYLNLVIKLANLAVVLEIIPIITALHAKITLLHIILIVTNVHKTFPIVSTPTLIGN